ncbi:insulinase family protein [Candidatus Pacearchaeota archaeon]|nr:insulinase family protein [Candidatus Pacearchaeota archaeon]
MRPEFYKKKLENGIVMLFEKRNLPIVSISANVKQGSGYESGKVKGISHVIEHMLFKGTKKRGYKEIASEIEKKGGILNGYTDEEITSFWCKLPKKHFSSGIDIVSDLISNPKFDEQEFEKEKKVILEEIKMYNDNPQAYVLFKIKELLYKEPFGLPGIGSNESVSQLTKKNIVEYYNAQYKSNKTFFCVVGNTNIEEIEEYASKFKKSEGEREKIIPVKINKTIIEAREGIDQANFVFGFHVPSQSDKNRYAPELFNAVLSSGMSSRLFDEIREKRGAAYSVKGSVEQGKDFGFSSIYVGTTKDKVEICKEIILKEIKNMKSLSQKELDEAKEQLIGLRNVESEESINTMNGLIDEEINGDAEEYYNYEENVLKTKLEDVRAISNIKNYSFIALVPK